MTRRPAHQQRLTLARRAEREPSVIREILKVTRKSPASSAGWRPAVAQDFPRISFAEASAAVLANDGPAALQYAASEGFAPCARLTLPCRNVDPIGSRSPLARRRWT